MPTVELPVPGVRAAVIDRRANVDLMAANCERLNSLLGGSQPVQLEQGHGCQVVVAEFGLGRQKGDALYTTKRRVACLVRSADCVPVLLAAADGNLVCAVHAGWRGLAAGIIENAAVLFRGLSPCAYIGPAICRTCYCVGPEVRTALTPHGEDLDCFARSAAGGWHADLGQLVRRRLIQSGITGPIVMANECTAETPSKYYSVRGEGAQTGRFATAIWIA